MMKQFIPWCNDSSRKRPGVFGRQMILQVKPLFQGSMSAFWSSPLQAH